MINTGKFIKSQVSTITLFLAIVAVVTGFFNTYQIKHNTNSGVVYSNSNGQPLPSPDKIVDKIPEYTPFLGSAEASLTLIEFGDYQCPYCEAFFTDTFPVLKKEYIDTGKIKFVFMDMAFLGQESKDAANAAYCANEQGKFWQYHDALYLHQKGENTGGFAQEHLVSFASDLKLDMSAFSACLTSSKYTDLIAEEMKLAQEFGVRGTPTLFIGKNLIQGNASIDNIKKVIDSNL